MSIGQEGSGKNRDTSDHIVHGDMSYVIDSTRQNETLRIMADGTNLSFHERLEYAVSLVSPAKLKLKLPRSIKQMGRYLKGADVPWSVLVAVSSASGVPVDWIAGGRPTFGPSEFDKWRESLAPNEIPDEFAFLPRYSVDASAGPGLVVSAEDIEEAMAFRRDWLRRIGATVGASGLITARGDSMAPTIPDGSLMLVDTSDTEPVDGCIYAITRDSTLLVKRVQRISGALKLISDNPIYGAEEIPLRDLDGLRIAGRIRWIGRTV